MRINSKKISHTENDIESVMNDNILDNNKVLEKEYKDHIEAPAMQSDTKKTTSQLEIEEAYRLEIDMLHQELTEARKEFENLYEKYSTLYDYSPVGMISFNEKGCIKEINLTACTLLGCERYGLLDKPFSIFLSLTNIKKFFKHIRAVGRLREKETTILQINTLDKKELRIRLESIHRQNINGEENFIQSALIDVTEQLNTSFYKSENEKQLQTIINMLPVLVSRHDVENNYLFSNQVHDNIFLPKNIKSGNKNLSFTLDAELFNTLKPHIKEVLSGREVIFETEVFLAGRGEKLFRINLFPKFSPKGYVVSYFLVMTDISAYQKTQTDIMSHLTALSHNSRIQLVGQMTAEIAHEINQPLAAIANYARAGLNLFQKEHLDKIDIEDLLLSIDQQVHRASDIIHHLRNFSKKHEMQCNKNNINRLIKQVLRFMATDRYWYTLNVSTKLDESLPECYCDSILIEQVLVNVLHNAFEVLNESNNKEPMVKITTTGTANSIIITISDNGPGIEFSLLETVFIPFFTTKDNGVGLGLSICKSIVELHNGKLWATKNRKTGSTFYIELPLHDKPT